MDFNEILNAISQYGFPVIACIVMWKQNGAMQKTLTEFATTLTKISERLEELARKIEDLKK